MGDQIISWYDDTLKKYVEVTSATPLPTSAVAGSGASDVNVTSANGDATTRAGNTDAQPVADIGLVDNSRMFAYNGSTYDRLRTVAALGDATAGTGMLTAGNYGYNGATWDRLRSTGGALIRPTVGTHGNAWNAAVVLADGVSASVDCQYVSNISVFGNSAVAGNIFLQYSQDNTNFYDDDLDQISTGGNNFAFNATVGARYIRLKSGVASTITATIAGKG